MAEVNRFGSLAQLLNRKVQTVGAENAMTAVEKSGGTATEYLQQNQGYAQIVGVQFDDKGKVYDYIDPTGKSRQGDNPTVEITHHITKQNQFVPGRHTKVVRTGKGGIARNEATLDKMTDKGIALKTIQRQGTLRDLAGLQKSNQPQSTNNIPQNNN
jgi:hypothetical protein